jgi:transcription antitermination factor NusA-like protein
MKAPICNICLKTEDQLCSHCQNKLDDGKITDKEVEVSRILYELSDNNPSLQDSEIIQVLDADRVLVVVTSEGDGAKVVGKRGRVVKKLAEQVDKSIRVVEQASDDREVIKGLLSPGEIESINKVYTPDGTSRKVVVDEEYRQKVNLSVDELEQFMEEITDTAYTISFEEI